MALDLTYNFVGYSYDLHLSTGAASFGGNTIPCNDAPELVNSLWRTVPCKWYSTVFEYVYYIILYIYYTYVFADHAD